MNLKLVLALPYPSCLSSSLGGREAGRRDSDGGSGGAGWPPFPPTTAKDRVLLPKLPLRLGILLAIS